MKKGEMRIRSDSTEALDTVHFASYRYRLPIRSVKRVFVILASGRLVDMENGNTFRAASGFLFNYVCSFEVLLYMCDCTCVSFVRVEPDDL